MEGAFEFAGGELEQPGGVARLVKTAQQQRAVHGRDAYYVAAVLTERVLSFQHWSGTVCGIDEDAKPASGLGDQAEPALGVRAESDGARSLWEGLGAEAAELGAVLRIPGVAHACPDVRAPAAP